MNCQDSETKVIISAMSALSLTTNSKEAGGAFTFFTKFPRELQLKILVLITDRSDALIHHKGEDDRLHGGARRYEYWSSECFGIDKYENSGKYMSPSPAVLHICQWTRDEFMTKENVNRGHMTFGLWRTFPTDKQPTFFIGDRDTFYVQDDFNSTMNNKNEGLWRDYLCTKRDSIGCSGAGMHNLKHLAMTGITDHRFYKKFPHHMLKLETVAVDCHVLNKADAALLHHPIADSDADIRQLSARAKTFILDAKQLIRMMKEAYKKNCPEAKVPVFVIRNYGQGQEKDTRPKFPAPTNSYYDERDM